MTSPAASKSPVSRNRFWDQLAKLKPGECATFIGFESMSRAEGRPAHLSALLYLEPPKSATPRSVIAGLLDDLADVALATWPAWPLSPPTPWRRAADRLAASGRRPRFARVPPVTQFRALHPAAGAPILLFPTDPLRPERAAAMIAALEWARGHGAPVVALLDEMPMFEPPWDRILYGALIDLPETPAPLTLRFVPAPRPGPCGSPTERRMRAALASADDLAGLFDNEVTLHLSPLGPSPRVDLLWRDGKVVVELDGAEHERDPNYSADRHRDYELLVAGYLVLRLTNAEIELDLARSIDKIRRVVNLRRTLA